jgi:hypothetical protein
MPCQPPGARDNPTKTLHKAVVACCRYDGYARTAIGNSDALRGSNRDPLAGPRREKTHYAHAAGRHFGRRRLPPVGNPSSLRRRCPLAVAQAGIQRMCSVLLLPGDRLLRRRPVRSRLQAVQAGLPSPASVRSEFADGAPEVNHSRSHFVPHVLSIVYRHLRPGARNPVAIVNLVEQSHARPESVTYVDANGSKQTAAIVATDLPAALVNSTSANGKPIPSDTTVTRHGIRCQPRQCH